jgi:hypothetical protein
MILLPFDAPVKGLDDEALTDVSTIEEFETCKKIIRHEDIGIFNVYRNTSYDPTPDLVPECFKDLRTTYYENIAVKAFGTFEDLLDRVAKDHIIGKIKRRRTAKYNVLSAGEWPADRAPRVCAHYDGVADGRSLKMLKIDRVMPWQLSSFSDR